MNAKSMTFRPGPDAELLEALAFMLRSSRNEVLRRGLHALAKEHEPYVHEVVDTLARIQHVDEAIDAVAKTKEER